MEIDVTSSEGNGLVIMGYVRKLLENAGRKDEIRDVMDRMTGGDYENLKAVAEEVSNGSITFYDPREDEE